LKIESGEWELLIGEVGTEEELEVVFSKRQVSLIVTIKIDGAVAGCAGGGVVAEIKSGFEQTFSGYFDFTAGVERIENPSIPSQGVIDCSHEVIYIAVTAIVVRAAALIRAEFFVGAAHEAVSTGKAVSFRHG
jgi:hypothetical protein